MTVHITDMIFPVSVTVTVPKYPNVIKLTTNKTIAILLNIPLYLIDATLLLSNQGTTNSIATAAAIRRLRAQQLGRVRAGASRRLLRQTVWFEWSDSFFRRRLARTRGGDCEPLATVAERFVSGCNFAARRCAAATLAPGIDSERQ